MKITVNIEIDDDISKLMWLDVDLNNWLVSRFPHAKTITVAASEVKPTFAMPSRPLTTDEQWAAMNAASREKIG